MDIERAIEHLLELHAKAEIRMEKAEERMDRADARMDRFEKQLLATRDLVRAGIVYVSRLARGVKELRESVSELKETVSALAQAQKRSDARIDRLADLMLRQYGNGRRRTGR
jgi:chromosome segregation ATPase